MRTLTFAVDTVIVDNFVKYARVERDFLDCGARTDDESARDAVDLQKRESKKTPFWSSEPSH